MLDIQLEHVGHGEVVQLSTFQGFEQISVRSHDFAGQRSQTIAGDRPYLKVAAERLTHDLIHRASLSSSLQLKSSKHLWVKADRKCLYASRHNVIMISRYGKQPRAFDRPS